MYMNFECCNKKTPTCYLIKIVVTQHMINAFGENVSYGFMGNGWMQIQ